MQEHSAARRELEARVAQLERRQRRMRWGYLGFLLLLVGSCAREPAVPQEILAREFKVVGQDGAVLASLGSLPWAEQGALTVFDRKNGGEGGAYGPSTVVLSHGGSTVRVEAGRMSMLVMSDPSGKTGAKLSAHHDEHRSALWLTDGSKSIFRSP